MQEINNKIDISILPENAKREILDFYTILKNHYTKNNKKRESKFFNILNSPISVQKIIIPDRDQIHGR